MWMDCFLVESPFVCLSLSLWWNLYLFVIVWHDNMIRYMLTWHNDMTAFVWHWWLGEHGNQELINSNVKFWCGIWSWNLFNWFWIWSHRLIILILVSISCWSRISLILEVNWLNYGPSYIQFIFQHLSNSTELQLSETSTSWFKMWKCNQDSSMEFKNFYHI